MPMADDPAEQSNASSDDASKGISESSEALFASVYLELKRLSARRMREESPDHTLQPTALVHEVFLKLSSGDAPEFNDRQHFLAAAAQAMRRILVDHARTRKAAKRGGGAAKFQVQDGDVQVEHDPDTLIDIDAALVELEAQDAELAQLVTLRFFAGLNIDEAAEAMSMSRATAKRRWAYARAWLQTKLDGPGTN